MKKLLKKNINLIIFILSLFVTVVLYLVFITSPHYNTFLVWAKQNVFLLFSIIVLIKIIGIIWPPIPGGFLSWGSIPFMGWQLAYLSDLIGNIIGSIVTYYIGRKYGFKILKKLFDESLVKKIKSLKFKKERGFEMVFLYRVLGTVVLSEVITYGAGILKMPFLPFLLASITAHLVYNLPAYFLFNAAIYSANPILVLGSLVALIILIYKTKGRYFE